MSETGAGEASQPIFREIGVANRERAYQWKSTRPLAMAVAGAIALRVALDVVEGAGLIWRLTLLGSAPGGLSANGPLMSGIRASDQLVLWGARLGLLSLLPCYLFGAMWIYRAASNVRARGARRLSSSPGWAVGWYAVPFMSLFRPLQDMVEIWKASRAPQAWASQPTPRLLAFWWAAWLLTNFGGVAASLTASGAGTLPGLVTFSRSTLIFQVIESAAAILFLTVVWRTTNAQTATHQGAESTADVFA
jgi:hypothetical protein